MEMSNSFGSGTMIYTLTLNPALDRELTVPAFAFDKVLRANAVRVDYGGKGFNVSRALAALGAESIALGFVGGATGESLTMGLADLGIRTDFVQVAGETRTNVSIVTEDHAHYLKVNDPGPAITPAEQTALLQKIRALAQPGDWWVLAGSLPPGVLTTFYAEVIRLVQSAGAHAVLDTSGEPLRVGCTAMPFLVKPNAAEAGELAGTHVSSPDQACDAFGKIHALGVQNVVISLGRVGALYSDGQSVWQAEPPEVDERNPIGAGDALVAGLVWALSCDCSGPEALRWGVACGAAAASLDGTAMGQRSLVENLARKVRVVSAS
jgi:1-phosphofructokinase family hexose kinase